MDSLGFAAIHVRDTEASLHDDEQRQYRNDAEPLAMVALLRRLADRSPVSPASTAFLLGILRESRRGAKRIPGLLPAGTVVAHKIGTSGAVNGLSAATNDVGLITLPGGRELALAVFITDARADPNTCERVIAEIARAIYDDALRSAAPPARSADTYFRQRP